MQPAEKPVEKTDRLLLLNAVLGPLVLLPLMAALLFIPAGDAGWAMGWAVLAVYLGGLLATNLLVSLRNPGLARERLHIPPSAKKWDRTLTTLANLSIFLMLPAAGLNRRCGWPPEVDLALQWSFLAVYLLGYTLFGWAMLSNRFFSSQVRIQADRGHVVESGGPYRFVRHPGYLGAVVTLLSIPLALGSVWAAVFGVISAGLYILRTALEDKTLLQELPGYREYARVVRYRLLPLIW